MKGGHRLGGDRAADGLVVAALVAVNAVGDIIDPATGKVVAGVRDRRRQGARRRAASCCAPARDAARAPRAGENTTHRRRRDQRQADQGRRRRRWRRWRTTVTRARSPRPHARRRRHDLRAGDRSLGRRARTSGMIGALAAEAMADAIVRAVTQSQSLAACRRRASSAPCRRGSSRRGRSRIDGARSSAVARRRDAALGLAPSAGARLARAGDRPVRGALPVMPQGVAAGDVGAGSRRDLEPHAIARRGWSSSTRRPNASPNVRRVAGPAALEASDFTARDRAHRSAAPASASSTASLPGPRRPARVQPAGGRQLRHRAGHRRRRDVTIAWSADTVGQGWGINPEWGGLRLYETMRRAEPDVFIHCGDTIYADQPVRRRGEAGRRDDLEEPGDGGEVEGRRRRWTTSAAPTSTTCIDEHMRRFNAEVAQIVHVGRPRGPGQLVSDARPVDRRRSTRVKSMALLADARAAGVPRVQPACRSIADDRSAIYRTRRLRPARRDLRARPAQLPRRRTARTASRRSTDESALVGRAAARWLKARLAASTRDVEGHRQRPADRRRSCRDAPARLRGVRQRRRRRAARARARDRRPAAVHQGPRASATSCGSRRTSTTAPRTTTPHAREIHRLRSVLGVRRRPAERRDVRARTGSTRRSGPR